MRRLLVAVVAFLPVFVLSSPIEIKEGSTTEEPKETPLPTVSRDQSFLVLEEYKPLASAYNKKDRAKAHAIKSKPVSKPQQVEVLVEFPGEKVEEFPEFSASGARQLGRISHFQLQTDKGPLVFDPQSHKTESHWLGWSRFGPCSNGERTRFRQCLEVNNLKCEGSSFETQKCFGLQNSNIPFASDPLTIEKEIAG